MNIPYEYHLERDHYTRSAPILLGSDHSIDAARSLLRSGASSRYESKSGCYRRDRHPSVNVDPGPQIRGKRQQVQYI